MEDYNNRERLLKCPGKPGRWKRKRKNERRAEKRGDFARMRCQMEVLLCLSIALAVGLLMTRFNETAWLPAVTGYLLAGILVGPYCLGSFGSFLAERGVAYAGRDRLSLEGRSFRV